MLVRPLPAGPGRTLAPGPAPAAGDGGRRGGDPVAHLAALWVDVERTPVLRNLHLTLRPGEAVGVLGSNGSGKTTLLEVLATLRQPRAGTARVLGADVSGPARFGVRPDIVLVGHTPAAFPALSLRENLAFLAGLTGAPVAAAEAALAAVGLTGAADRTADRCSLGMLRRLDLARVLVYRPRLLLLDEPFAGLDPQAAGLVGALVADTVSHGGGAVVVSHEPDRLAAAVHRTLVLAAGELAPYAGWTG